MTEALIATAVDLMVQQRFDEARSLLRSVLDEDPLNWNAWYWAGQCSRYLNDIGGAIPYLTRATELKNDEPPIFLALGIAHQLVSDWDLAITAFGRAIEIDPDYELAYNSLAMTQKMCGELEKALHNYEAGLLALARRIVKSMHNSRNNPLVGYKETSGRLWLEYVFYATTFSVCNDEGIHGLLFPTAEAAEEIVRTGRHGGLYWSDVLNKEGKTVRLFLPNFFDTYRDQLSRDVAYSTIIGNRGTVLELLGRNDEARQHFDEAIEFLP